jgi:hypothetical protein
MEGFILKLVIEHCCGQYEQYFSSKDGEVKKT